MKRRLTWPLLMMAAIFALCSANANAMRMTFKDPKRDDKGPGKYSYPTHSSYSKGDFDITKVVIKKVGANFEFRIRVKNVIRDVWKSKTWGGNGFSVQFAQVYIRTGKGGGFKKALPGLNVSFAKKWNYVVLISPQGATRLKSEINLKAKAFKKRIVIPTTTRSQGKTLIAVVPASALSGFNKSSGIQVLMQSNEGYPRKTDLLTRPVNQYGGAHRFGGGNDGDCDPHVIDMLAGKAKGKSSEKKAQYKQLMSHSCKGKGKHATLSYVYSK